MWQESRHVGTLSPSKERREAPLYKGRSELSSRTVSIVLILWNSEKFLERCLSGIATQTHQDIDLHVIDNASTDGSVTIVESRFPSAHVIWNRENRGFSAAANQGIAASKGDFVLLLNPDVFLEPEYVRRCVEAIESKGETFGSATGKLLRGRGPSIEPTKIVDSKGMEMTRNGRHLDVGSGLVDDAGDDLPFEVFGVSGAAGLYRRTFLDDISIDGKPFDENFFVYREDADVAWRGRLFGWRSLCVPDAIAYHVRTVTPERRRSLPPSINMHSVKNRFLLRLKNQGRYLTLRNLLSQAMRDIVVVAAALTVERSSLPAFGWLWQHRRTIMQSRRAIQARRRVSDRELAHWFTNG